MYKRVRPHLTQPSEWAPKRPAEKHRYYSGGSGEPSEVRELLVKPASPRCPAAHHRILYTTYYESIASSGPFFGYYFFNSLLTLLQLLHVFWSCLILRMIHSFMKKGQMEKDVRSDVEESDSSEGEVAQECARLKNGAAPTDGPRSRAAVRLANGHVSAT